MKRRSFFIGCLLILAFSIPVILVSGQVGYDDQGNPNDPAVNDRANACYDGGSMTDKCDNDWAWTCGWYLIRVETGMIGREAFPLTCASLLPEAVVISTATPILQTVMFTATPIPTTSATPTSSATPTDTPTPTETLMPTDTPTSTETLMPTDTPTPTETSTPTDTPTPTEIP